MKKIVATVPEAHLEFEITENVDTPALKKKLAKLGWPNVWLNFSSGPDLQMTEIEPGKFKYVDGDFSESFPLAEPDEDGSFTATYNPENNSVSLQFSGNFIIYNVTDQEASEQYTRVSEAYLSIIGLNNDKGKKIKLPKDQYGMSPELDATVDKDQYGDVYYKLPLQITSSEADF